MMEVLEDPLAETRVLASLWPPHARGHENVNRLMALYEDDYSLFIVLAYCDGGDLQQVVSNHGGPLPEADTRTIMWQLLQGVEYLHTHDVAHRDLSLENTKALESLKK